MSQTIHPQPRDFVPKFFLLVTLFLGIACCGCSSSQRASVSGNVSFDGKPVKQGEITFLPKGEGLQMASTEVANGKYALPEESGPSPGAYAVRITAVRPTGKKVKPPAYLGKGEELTDVMAQFLPAKFNDRTTLNVEISPGENKHDFELKSQ